MRVRRWCLLLVWAWCCCCAHALQRPVCPDAERCVARRGGQDEYPYFVDGVYLYIKFNDGGYFSMKCDGNVTLDNSALPRFESTLRVNHVTLSGCPARSRSYADALAALNVRAGERLTVSGGGGELSRAHLAGLDRLEALAFSGMRLAPDAFEATPHLRRLRLDTVSPVLVERLPASLTDLVLVITGVRHLRREELAHFSRLASLVVRDTVELRVEAAAPLAELTLQAGAVRLDAALPHTLGELTLFGWAEDAPTPWTSCGALRSLTVFNASARLLPDGWLANCTALRELKIDLAPSLGTLAPGTFRGADSLASVSLTRCALRELPGELLDGAKSLQFLDLSRNRLHELPNGFFSLIKNLTELNLTHNQLTNDVFSSVSTVTSLRVLRLDHNPQLGDACSGGVNALRGSSRLQTLKLLAELHLRNTGAHYICRDWRETMPRLTELDLGANAIDTLTYSDLQFASDVSVQLADNNVTRLLYTRLDYAALNASRAAYCTPQPGGAAPRAASRGTVALPAARLRCDCGAAWAARALRDCPAHVRLAAPPACASGAALAAVPLDELVCGVAPRDCPAPAPCRCAALVDERGRVRRVDCAGANLTAPPALAPLRPAPAERWLLRLSNNSIARLAAVRLPPHVRELDLRYNLLTEVDEVIPLLEEGRRVWLRGNPLRCDCAAAAALGRLRDLRRLVPDHARLCAAPAACAGRAGPGRVLLLALAPLLLSAALAAGAAARRPWREWLKAALRRLFCGPRPAPDDDRPYDAFISFSHQDEELVRSLLARLEGGARPYRVCVHYRDWAPGGWIPAQIAASVRRSRVTVAVVSAHFLASRWARAEFREAYGAALREAEPRLVVVLLDEPARLPLDAELRRYLAANTYVRWGDPWFWQKLRAALPPPRGPAPPPAGAPPGDPPGDPPSPAAEAGAAA